MCYSLWYNAPTMLPAGSLEAEEQQGHQMAMLSLCAMHYTTSCNTKSSAPEDGQNNCPKHVELTGITNKPLLLHLVGCLYRFISMMHGHANIKPIRSVYTECVRYSAFGKSLCT